MGVRIKIGGLSINLGGLFKKRKKEEIREFETKQVSELLDLDELKDAVLNCCEQTGAFDEFGIEDPEVIDVLCTNVATLLDGKELTHSELSGALGEGFASCGFEVKGNLANMFASAYISSYR